MSHTPGPWTLVFDVDGVPGFIRGKTTCICDFGKDVPKPEDARLIATAPELYEALEELRDKVWRIIDLHRDSEARAEANMALERANAALAKARGDKKEENA